MPDSTTPLQEGAPLITWLRTVLWGAIVIPALAFVLLSIWGYQRAYRDAETTVTQASALALRQAERTFETARKIAVLADEASSGTDDFVRANERAVHQRLSDLSAGAMAIVNLNVWTRDGASLVRSHPYPTDPGVTIADRAYFNAQKEADLGTGISEVVMARQSKIEVVNVTIRRRRADGEFVGIVSSAISPDFFADYYRSLASEDPNVSSFSMVRTDGTILARWPKLADGRTAIDPGNVVFLQVRAGATSGLAITQNHDDRPNRLVSFRRVGDLPVYVTAGLDRAAMYGDWLRFVGLVGLIFMPIWLGLVYVSWVALKKTRLEQQMLIAMQMETQKRSQAERALLESQKLDALAQLTGGVAHDFNNLLTIVSNNVHILGRRHPAMKDERSLTAIARAVQSGVRLTRQLLSFSRKQALRPELVRLQDWLPMTEGLIRSTLGSNTGLVFSIDPQTAPITVDLAELELALINTALNAHHAMPGGGTLRICASNAAPTTPAKRMVVVTIEDSGRGIAPELIGKVFEPFFSTKGEGKGSGLGLSQVQGLCEQAGGFATIESTPDVGTKVAMYFPAIDDVEASIEPERRDEDIVLEGRVLLVEDNDDVASVTEQLLRTAGLAVTRAVNADAALKQLGLQGAAPDMILSDISMPGSMDGIQLAFVVRQRWPHIPVLLMTGFAERIDEALGARMPVLAKPVHPLELLREVEKLLTQHRAVASRS